MDRVIRVAAIQSRPENSMEANLKSAQRLLIEAAKRGAKIVVLPENFAYYKQTNLHAIGQAEATQRGPVRQYLSEQARQLGLWIIGGTVPVLESPLSRPFARSLVYNPQGNCVGYYDKIHLFDAFLGTDVDKQAYCESDHYSPGESTVTLQTDCCNLGLSVCYDLRFSELYQQLSVAKAHVVAVPSAFTAVTGEAHWQVLLRARAIENQFFVIGANMVDRGHHSKGLWGGSAIVDPWGTVLASLDDDIGAVVADLDISMVEKVQQKMPVQMHRKLKI